MEHRNQNVLLCKHCELSKKWLNCSFYHLLNNKIYISPVIHPPDYQPVFEKDSYSQAQDSKKETDSPRRHLETSRVSSRTLTSTNTTLLCSSPQAALAEINCCPTVWTKMRQEVGSQLSKLCVWDLNMRMRKHFCPVMSLATASSTHVLDSTSSTLKLLTEACV